MRKKIIAAVTATALLLSLTACATENTSTPASSDTTSSQQTESSVTDESTGGENTSDDATSEDASSDDASSDDASSDDASSDEESSEPESSEPAEYVPYELGGEVTPTMIADSRLNEGNKVRLANFLKKAQNGETVTVGYIGGSITQGSSAGAELCYAKLTTDWLQTLCPQATINYVNAGIGATGSYIGVHRANADLLSRAPDLVIVEFSVNDTTENTERNKESYDSLLRTIWNSSSAPAIITLTTTQEDGTSFQKYHAEIATTYDLPVISYRNAILNVIKNGDIAWSDISNDNIHPDVEGHLIVSQLLQAYIADVAANLDSIGGSESNFSKAATNAGFENGTLLTPKGFEPTTNGFVVKTGNWGGFEDMWVAVGTASKPFDNPYFEFTIDAKSIGILYGKMINLGTNAEVYVDGVLVTTLSSDFTGGWGNYVECTHIATFDKSGTHTVKIVPLSNGGSSAFYINAIAVS